MANSMKIVEHQHTFAQIEIPCHRPFYVLFFFFLSVRREGRQLRTRDRSDGHGWGQLSDQGGV